MLLQQKQLSIQQVQSIAYQSLKALAFLHSKQIAHRDFKSSNLLIFNDGIVKLGDLGFARYFDRKMTSLKGSPAYLAPEIAQGIPYTCKSDCFSACSTFYELITGKPAIQAENYVEVIKKLCSQDLEIDFSQDIFKLYPEFTDFLKHGLEINPDKRYSSEQLLNHIWFKQLNKQDQNIQLSVQEDNSKEQTQSENDFDETTVSVYKQNQKEKIVTLKSNNQKIQFIISSLIESFDLSKYQNIIPQELIISTRKLNKSQQYVKMYQQLQQYVINNKLQQQIQQFVTEQLKQCQKQQININYFNIIVLLRMFLLLNNQKYTKQVQEEFPMDIYYENIDQKLDTKNISELLKQILLNQNIVDKYVKIYLIHIFLILSQNQNNDIKDIIKIYSQDDIRQIQQLQQLGQQILQNNQDKVNQKIIQILNSKNKEMNDIEIINSSLICLLIEKYYLQLIKQINIKNDIIEENQQKQEFYQNIITTQLNYLYFQPEQYKYIIQIDKINFNQQIIDNIQKQEIKNSPYKYLLDQFKQNPRQSYIYANSKFSQYFKDQKLTFNQNINKNLEQYYQIIKILNSIASDYNIQKEQMNKFTLCSLITNYDKNNSIMLINQYEQKKKQKILQNISLLQRLYLVLQRQDKFLQYLNYIQIQTTSGKKLTLPSALLLECQLLDQNIPLMKIKILSELLQQKNISQIQLQLGQQCKQVPNFINYIYQQIYLKFDKFQIKYQQTWKNNEEYYQTDLGSQIIMLSQQQQKQTQQFIQSSVLIISKLIDMKQISNDQNLLRKIKQLIFNVLEQNIYLKFYNEKIVEYCLQTLQKLMMEKDEISLLTSLIMLSFENSKQRQQFALFTMRHNQKSILECILDGCEECLCTTNGAGITQQQSQKYQQIYQYNITFKTINIYINIIQNFIEKYEQLPNNYIEIFAILSQMIQFCYYNYQQNNIQQFQESIYNINEITLKILKKIQNLSLIIAILAEYNYIYYDLNCIKYIQQINIIDIIILTIDYIINLNNPLTDIFRCQLKQSGIIQRSFINEAFNMLLVNQQFQQSKTVNLLLNIIYFTLQYNIQECQNLLPYFTVKFTQQIIQTKDLDLINQYYRILTLIIQQVKYADRELYQILEYTITLIFSELELIQNNHIEDITIINILSIWTYIQQCLNVSYYSYINIISYMTPLLIQLLKIDLNQFVNQDLDYNLIVQQSYGSIKFSVKKQIVSILKICNFYHTDIQQRNIQLNIPNYENNIKQLQLVLLQYLKQYKIFYDNLGQNEYNTEIKSLAEIGLIDQQIANTMLV